MKTLRAEGPLLRLVQQQDARRPPPGPAVGAGSAPSGRFATTIAQAPVQALARPHSARVAR